MPLANEIYGSKAALEAKLSDLVRRIRRQGGRVTLSAVNGTAKAPFFYVEISNSYMPASLVGLREYDGTPVEISSKGRIFRAGSFVSK